MTDVEKLEPLYPAGGDVKQYSCYGNSMAGLQKLKKNQNYHTIQQFQFGVQTQNNWKQGLEQTCANAQSSTVHKNRDTEAIQMLTSKPMD